MALTLPADGPLAIAVVDAIRSGKLVELKRLLAEHPGLATTRVIGNDVCAGQRTLLHIATDWPGHFPHAAATVAALVDAGADVNARFVGAHTETPLNWAASSNDVAVIDALLDAGADIEATGAVMGGGSPLADARGFGQWQAARRLLERGARPSLNDAATLGLMDRLDGFFEGPRVPSEEQITRAFWAACHGGQRGDRLVEDPRRQVPNGAHRVESRRMTAEVVPRPPHVALRRAHPAVTANDPSDDAYQSD